MDHITDETAAGGGASPLDAIAPTPEQHGFIFHGSAKEYFRIWIVNIALSVLTLGVYSAWAKVRNERYFHGNTELAGHRFDYLGDPIVILRGRLIAFAVLAIAAIIANFDLVIGLSIYYLVIPLLLVPIATLLSLRFRARMTQYRNVRFGFDGKIGGAYWAFVAWPIFTILSFFTLAPLGYAARQKYMIGKSRFGRLPFSVSMLAGPLYKSYFLTWLVGAALLIAVSIVAAIFAGVIAVLLSGIDMPEDQMALLIQYINPMTYVTLFVYIGLAGYLRARLTNYVYSNTQIGGKHHLQSTLDPFRFMWIEASNWAVIGITFGLGLPWARVRMAKYRADHTHVTIHGSLDDIASQEEAQISAVGEEFGDFMGFEIGL